MYLVFKGFKCVAKVSLSFQFFSQKRWRYFYAHGNNTVMKRSKLVCTPDDFTNMKEKLWKWILLIFVHEREPIPSGSFTNWQTWQFLQRYSKMYPWVVKILYYLNRSWKIKMWIALLTNRTRKNHTKTIIASLEHLLSTCMELRDSKKKHSKFSNFS